MKKNKSQKSYLKILLIILAIMILIGAGCLGWHYYNKLKWNSYKLDKPVELSFGYPQDWTIKTETSLDTTPESGMLEPWIDETIDMTKTITMTNGNHSTDNISITILNKQNYSKLAQELKNVPPGPRSGPGLLNYDFDKSINSEYKGMKAYTLVNHSDYGFAKEYNCNIDADLEPNSNYRILIRYYGDTFMHDIKTDSCEWIKSDNTTNEIDRIIDSIKINSQKL